MIQQTTPLMIEVVKPQTINQRSATTQLMHLASVIKSVATSRTSTTYLFTNYSSNQEIH